MNYYRAAHAVTVKVQSPPTQTRVNAEQYDVFVAPEGGVFEYGVGIQRVRAPQHRARPSFHDVLAFVAHRKGQP